jgi:succinate dehydrogenase / fumarate reductase cytochrome b subunit
VADATTTPKYPQGRILALWRTTIGKKIVVAITGAIMAVWVLGHMVGNLKALGGPGTGAPGIDAYADWLRGIGEPIIPGDGVLWIVRATVLSALVLHVIAITQLWRRNRAARPAIQRRPPRMRSTIAARTMTTSGVVLLAFIIFHILHFTVRAIHPTPLVAGRVYANMDGAFAKWWIVAIYVGAVMLLGLHLYHALWSTTQTLGVDNPDRNPFFRRQAAVFSVVIAVGFATVPILFLTGALPDAKSPAATGATRAHR